MSDTTRAIVQTFGWIFSVILLLIGLGFITVSPNGGYFVILASIFANPLAYQFIKKYYKKFNLYISIFIALCLTVLGFTLHLNSNELKNYLVKSEEERALNKKIDEEASLKKREEIELKNKAEAEKQKLENEKLKAEQEKEVLKNAKSERAKEFSKKVSLKGGPNGFWLINENSKPFKIQNMSLNYDITKTTQPFKFNFPAGTDLNNIRKQPVSKESRVFMFTEFVNYPDEDTYFIKGKDRATNIEVQGLFDDPESEYGLNEFQEIWKVS